VVAAESNGFQTMKNIITKLSLADVTVGFLTGVPVAALAVLVFGDIGGVLGVFVGFLATTGSQRQRAALQLRIDTPVPLHWEVVINQMRVGSIADCDYAALEKAVHGDWRVYWAQGRNLVKVGVRAVEMLLFAVPAFLFWLALALVFFDPESAAVVAEALRAAPGSEIVAAIERYTTGVIIFFVVLMFLFAAIASPRLGYENMFRVELGEVLRRRVEAAAQGRLELVPCPSPVQAIVS